MHHHRATTFMPVQSAIVENADGSRTVWVGETEWRDRMRWVVGVTLRPGSSVVEADVRMLNRTPLAPLRPLLREPGRARERGLRGALPAGRRVGDVPLEGGLRAVAARARAVHGHSLRARDEPGVLEEPPEAGLVLRLPLRSRLPRRVRPRPQGRRRARGGPADGPRQEVLDVGQRAGRPHVGRDPDRRRRPVHRADDRRLLRQPARLLVDPPGGGQGARAALVPDPRAGRDEGGQRRRCPEPRRRGREGALRRQHDVRAAGHARAPRGRRSRAVRRERVARSRSAARARGGTAHRRRRDGPAPVGARRRRPRDPVLHAPAPAEDARAAPLHAAAGSGAGEERRGAGARRPAHRAVPQP